MAAVDRQTGATSSTAEHQSQWLNMANATRHMSEFFVASQAESQRSAAIEGAALPAQPDRSHCKHCMTLRALPHLYTELH